MWYLKTSPSKHTPIPALPTNALPMAARLLFLEDYQCDPAKNEGRDEADNLAKGFKHSAFAVRAGCFGRSIGRLNEDAAGVAFDVKFPHF